MLRQDDAGPRVALRHVQRCHRQGSADLPGREAAREKQPRSRAPTAPELVSDPSRLPGRTSVPTGALVLGVCVGQGGCPRPRGPAARRCRSRCRGGGAAAASRAGGRCGVCTFLTEAERHRGGRGDLPGGAAAGGQDRAARGSPLPAQRAPRCTWRGRRGAAGGWRARCRGRPLGCCSPSAPCCSCTPACSCGAEGSPPQPAPPRGAAAGRARSAPPGAVPPHRGCRAALPVRTLQFLVCGGGSK